MADERHLPRYTSYGDYKTLTNVRYILRCKITNTLYDSFNLNIDFNTYVSQNTVKNTAE